MKLIKAVVFSSVLMVSNVLGTLNYGFDVLGKDSIDIRIPVDKKLITLYNEFSVACSNGSLSPEEFYKKVGALFDNYSLWQKYMQSLIKEENFKKNIVLGLGALGALTLLGGSYYYKYYLRSKIPPAAVVSESPIETLPLEEVEIVPVRSVIEQLPDYSEFEKRFGISPYSSEWDVSKPLCKKILESYELYSNPLFLSWIRSAPGYMQHIAYLRKEVDTKNSKLRKRLKNVPGFESHTHLWWTGGVFGSAQSHYGFHDFIRAEDDRLKNN